MKKETMSIEELTQYNHLVENQILDADEKYQTYVQNAVKKQIEKDLHIAQMNENWMKIKHNFEEIKQSFAEMGSSFVAMNRESRRHLQNSYADVSFACQSFYQDTLSNCKKGLSIVSSYPGQIAEKIKNAKDKMVQNIREDIQAINTKIEQFGESIKTKLQSSYLSAKFAIMNFTAKRIEMLSNIFLKLHKNVEDKKLFIIDAQDNLNKVGGNDLKALRDFKQQVDEISKLKTDALNDNYLSLYAQYNTLLCQYKINETLNPTLYRAKTLARTLENTSKKITKLTNKEKKIDRIKDILDKISHSIKEKIEETTIDETAKSSVKNFISNLKSEPEIVAKINDTDELLHTIWAVREVNAMAKMSNLEPVYSTIYTDLKETLAACEGSGYLTIDNEHGKIDFVPAMSIPGKEVSKDLINSLEAKAITSSEAIDKFMEDIRENPSIDRE